MLNQSGESRVDTIVKLVLIFFISLLSFSVGVFVGGQVAESDYRAKALEKDDYGNFSSKSPAGKDHKVSEEELDKLTNEFLAEDKTNHGHKAAHDEHGKEKQHGAHKEAAHDKGHKTSDGFQKISRKNKHEGQQQDHTKNDPHSKNTTADHKKTLHHQTANANPAHKNNPHNTTKKMDSIKSAANFVADNMAPTATPKKKRKPASVLPGLGTTTIGKYTVQVGSYSAEHEAKNYASELKSKGFSAFYIPAQVRGRTWYRVSVGLFSDQKSAVNFQKELQAQTKIRSSLVQKIVR